MICDIASDDISNLLNILYWFDKGYDKLDDLYDNIVHWYNDNQFDMIGNICYWNI